MKKKRTIEDLYKSYIDDVDAEDTANFNDTSELVDIYSVSNLTTDDTEELYGRTLIPRLSYSTTNY